MRLVLMLLSKVNPTKSFKCATNVLLHQILLLNILCFCQNHFFSHNLMKRVKTCLLVCLFLSVSKSVNCKHLSFAYSRATKVTLEYPSVFSYYFINTKISQCTVHCRCLSTLWFVAMMGDILW